MINSNAKQIKAAYYPFYKQLCVNSLSKRIKHQSSFRQPDSEDRMLKGSNHTKTLTLDWHSNSNGYFYANK